MLFYASPILYVATLVPDELPAGRTCSNPIAAVLTQMRHARRRPDAPDRGRERSAAGAAADPARRSSSASFALGLWVFIREAPRIAENL